MNLLDSITSILLPSKEKALVCPRCDRDLSRHDPDYCKRAMSRRTFFMGVGGVVAAGAGVAALSKLPKYAANSELAKKLFDVAPAPPEQLVLEATHKIVTAGGRSVIRHVSRGGWIQSHPDMARAAGLKGPDRLGQYMGVYTKSEDFSRWEDAKFGDEYTREHRANGNVHYRIAGKT